MAESTAAANLRRKMRQDRTWSLSNSSSSNKKKQQTMSASAASNTNPAAANSARVRLYELFVQIEREFEILHAENASLQERLEKATVSKATAAVAATDAGVTTASAGISQIKFHTQTSTVSTTKGLYAHKLRSQTNKLRAQTNRFMSNLKGQGLNCAPVRRYSGHKDGVWEVSTSRMGLPIIGTASADHTAMIWGMHSGRALLQYAGHSGSVNSIRFHPSKELVLTASGDGSVHIWQCAVHLSNESASGRVASSEDELEDKECEEENQFSVLRTPLRSLHGHSGVVIAADWLPGGEQAVTAGWDKLACIWDTHTGQLLHQLSGHDEELTHAASHPTARLVVTSSKDSTFRLWDFREAIHSVSVFQGHQDTVTSAVFTQEAAQVVSGSDDRSARIWDLRNMRTPVAMIQSDSAVNRVSVSPSGLVAIPFDNRNVRLYDLHGNRIARLPRSSRQGHSRMVCCTAWAAESTIIEEMRPNLFTCGFDRITLGWSVQAREVDSAQNKTAAAAREQLQHRVSSGKEGKESGSGGGGAGGGGGGK